MYSNIYLYNSTACKYDDGCHEVGEVWHHSGCHKLKCSMTRKGSSVTFSIDSIEQGNISQQ